VRTGAQAWRGPDLPPGPRGSGLIFVKQAGGRETKLKFGNFRPKPAMPKKLFSEFRSQLQSQRQQLLEEVREKIAASGEGLGFANQSKVTDDDAIAGAAADLDVAMVVRESQELQHIEAALARIDDGSYGNCADCDSEIARPRLKAYPMATRCLACQEKHERLFGQAHKVTL